MLDFSLRLFSRLSIAPFRLVIIALSYGWYTTARQLAAISALFSWGIPRKSLRALSFQSAQLALLYSRAKTDGLRLPMKHYNIYLMNIDHDVSRLDKFNRQSRCFCISYIRVPAITPQAESFSGHSWLLGDSFASDKSGRFPPGNFCCFLSHREVWNEISQLDRPGIVLEDDVVLFCNPNTFLHEESLPPDFDIIFLNFTVSFALSSFGSPDISCHFYSCDDAAKALYYAGFSSNVLGAECYIISPEGARKLLALYDTYKYTFFTDWTIFVSALSESARSPFVESMLGHPLPPVLSLIPKVLNGYVMVPSFAHKRQKDSSCGRFNDSLGWLTRDQINAGYPKETLENTGHSRENRGINQGQY
jgi:GR25 family glycosyltransferase involved in LPS biosynthesis